MADKYTSRSNPKIKFLAQIARKPMPECFLVEGFHMVQMAAEEGALTEVFALEDPHIQGVKTSLVTREIIDKVCVSKNPEPICGLCSLKRNDEPLGERILVLDHLQDPGNVGTLLRTAVAFGFDDVWLLPNTCSPFNPKSLASSQGAIFKVRLHTAKYDDLEKLHGQGYAILGTALRDSVPMEDYPVPEKLALVLGNEGKGMTEEAIKKCDTMLKISIRSMESLNVAAAGAIFLHKFCLIKTKIGA
ncbi:MAG: RNA methyltransferase [Candidatus Enteromonas sp.]|nr:RNA methyltransferase [Candidatus Enteromonas sp.]